MRLDTIRIDQVLKLLKSRDQGIRLLGKLLIAAEGERHKIELQIAGQMQTHGAALPRAESLVTYLCDRIAHHEVGKTLTMCDAQLVGALVSDVAICDTRRLHSSGTVAAAIAAVANLVGWEPQTAVIVVPAELAHFGAEEDRGWFLPTPPSIVLVPPPSGRTLTHELVHATQPTPIEGPAAREQIVEGVTDALTSEAGEDFEDAPSYPAELAAVTALGQEAGWEPREWLLYLNRSSRPEELVADALPGSPNVPTAMHIFFEAVRAAAEGSIIERVTAARRVVHARCSAASVR